ncbi:polysaccharide deacetylase family protein [Bdellovibrio sp. SKB1291214]|uniref:polysaccharide deacetylase family protein n=1 Tax=Bdellovibrio sp. SKB1291214 TaxID=1732569 RepID=UPI000B515971|nr:polysaccharide deacetylase family protein [Bdellovibrio sp. SKB1291214]UYL10018.1 polysaccharide deacetylase family protein [Bdellovibrio sp. SKB1291214]
MNKVKRTFGSAAAILLLASCGNNVGQQIQNTVQINKEASSLAEWDASPSNPENVFRQWRQDNKGQEAVDKLSAQICGKLKTLDGLSLTIFENEIRNETNQPLVMPCKKELLAQLERHYTAERGTLKIKVNALSQAPSGNNFKFPDNVQYRDVSKGYYARAGDVAAKEIVLSFDDGPSPEYTMSVLRSLKEVNAKAHFFQLGKSIMQNSNVTKAVAADGHAVGTHSVTHSCLAATPTCERLMYKTLSFTEAVAEIKGGHQAAFDVLGFVEPFFRFPYGEVDAELRNFLNANSVAEFNWNIDSEDWKAQTNEDLLKNTLNQIDRKGRGILLLHDIHRRTAEILPQLLAELYNRGFSVVLLQPTDANARFNSRLVKKPVP